MSPVPDDYPLQLAQADELAAIRRDAVVLARRLRAREEAVRRAYAEPHIEGYRRALRALLGREEAIAADVYRGAEDTLRRLPWWRRVGVVVRLMVP